MSETKKNTSAGPPTGIRVIIVGAGFGGLACAIECYRKGHSVTLVEAFSELKPLGDIVTFGSNSAKIMRRWPGVAEQLDKASLHTDGITFRTFRGEYLMKQLWNEEGSWGETFNGSRGEIHEIVFKHAQSLGLDIRLGDRVVDYFESETEAGVIIEGGERLTGDVVLAADGVRSPARKIILDYTDHPKDAGYAVLRAWLDPIELTKNRLTADLVGKEDSYSAWIGTHHSLTL